MEHNKEANRPSARGSAPSEINGAIPEPNLDPAKQLVRRLGWASALFIASMIISVAVSGCGGTSEDTYVSNAEPADYQQTDDRYFVPDHVDEEQASSEAIVASETRAKQAGDLPTAGSMESWPPDMVVSISDTLVSPGEVVEVVAQATPDVAEITLWDGIGEKEPFYFDAAQGVWRTTYRAPLKPHWERTGLSVTAKNDANRWRRVWVFVRAESATTGVEPLEVAQEAAPEPQIENEPQERSGEEAPETEPELDGS